jgi:hypothetical protein
MNPVSLSLVVVSAKHNELRYIASPDYTLDSRRILTCYFRRNDLPIQRTWQYQRDREIGIKQQIC